MAVRVVLALALVTSLTVIVGGAAVTSPASKAAATPPKPNFVVIVTDDQRWDTIGRCSPTVDGYAYDTPTGSCMPKLQQDLIKNGMTFKRGYVTTSLCCPARASILTGQYAQHHGILSNHGFPAFNDSSTIATWLDGASYRTGLFGKYLNDYGVAGPLDYVPPGWDSWHAFWGAMGGDRGYKTYDLIEKEGAASPVVTPFSYTSSLDHNQCSSGDYYSTDQICGLAVNFLKDPSTAPFFLYFAPFGPHKPYQYAGRDSGKLNGLPMPSYPNLNQVPSPNPPSWLPTTPLTSTELNQIRASYWASMKTDLSIDDAIGSLYTELSTDGKLSNTVWVFLSDNGRAAGEHRYFDGKQCEFEECHHVPFVVVCPPTYCPGTTPDTIDSNHLALNIDIAPTLAALAGVTPPTFVDGSNMVPILENPSAPWRTSYVQTDLWGFAQNVLSRGATFDAADGHTYKYVMFTTFAEKELYDLTTDPWELTNLAGDGVHTAIEQQGATIIQNEFSLPQISITGPNGPTNQASPAFSWTSDKSGQFSCSLDAVPLTSCGSGLSGSQSTPVLSEGPHTFKVQEFDTYHNTGSSTASFTVDLTPPPAPTFSQTPPDPSGSSVAFAFTDAEAGSTFRCSLDGAPVSACTSPASYTALAAGPHTFSVLATDAAGNPAPSGASYGWTVNTSLDTTPPTVQMNKPVADSFLNATNVAASWTGKDNVKVTNYNLYERLGLGGSQTLVKTGTGTTYTRAGTPGQTYCYQVVAFDAAGNSTAGPERCAAVTLDDAAPGITYLGAVSHTAAAGAYQGTLSTLSGAGQEADYSFTGRKFGILARKAPDAGYVDVYVDGSLAKSVDLYSSNPKNLQMVWVQALTPGPHAIRVVWSTKKNNSSSGRNDSLDGIGAIT